MNNSLLFKRNIYNHFIILFSAHRCNEDHTARWRHLLIFKRKSAHLIVRFNNNKFNSYSLLSDWRDYLKIQEVHLQHEIRFRTTHFIWVIIYLGQFGVFSVQIICFTLAYFWYICFNILDLIITFYFIFTTFSFIQNIIMPLWFSYLLLIGK